MALTLRFSALSDVGLLRQNNQDSAYAGPRLLVVADGMGGHVGGDVASSVAVATLASLDEDPPGADLLDRLGGAVRSANEALREMVSNDPTLEGMGTTVTALLRAGSRFGLVHIGDSRCYLLREGELVQVTHDHTFVQRLVDEGRITAEEASHHPQRSLLIRALDGRGDVELDLSIREARAGDRYLLCSDGLSGVVSEETIRETLGEGDPDAVADALVQLALRGGGPDNITVVVADVVDVEDLPSDIPTVVGAATAAKTARQDGAGTGAAHRAAALTPRPEEQDTAVDPLEHEAGQTRVRKRWPALVGLLVVGLLLLGAGGWGGWTWTQRQYYVGAHESFVTIFRGIAQTIGPIRLSRVYEQQSLRVAALPPFRQDDVRQTIPASDGLSSARDIVANLRSDAAECAAPTPTPAPVPPPTIAAAAPSPADPAPSPADPAPSPADPIPTPSPSASAGPNPRCA
jgi:protein phosphatase